MLGSIALLLAVVGVGILVGSVGVGGILLPSVLTMLTGMAIHQSMATSLFTFIFAGIAGTFFFHRQGSIDWKLAQPVCAGAAVAGFLGAWANSRLNAPSLALILAVIIILAGIYTLRAGRAEMQAAWGSHPHRQRLLLVGIGAVAGFGSGLTGVGGPVLSVPLMVLSGFSPLTAIGVSQVIQIVGAASGTLGNLRYGSIDFGVAGLIIVFEIGGVFIGAHIAHIVDTHILKKFVGILCIIVGAVFLFRTIA